MMLVVGLMEPIPLALSMFPIGNKAIMTWLTTFLSLGFCKICFTLISGLSSLAMVYSEPDNVDMLVAAMVLGDSGTTLTPPILLEFIHLKDALQRHTGLKTVPSNS
jgi:hypothetical protein